MPTFDEVRLALEEQVSEGGAVTLCGGAGGGGGGAGGGEMKTLWLYAIGGKTEAILYE